MKQLIVNADDFGLTAGVNRGIVEAHARGIVTSTSLMVRASAAGEAPAFARTHPNLGFGLHIDLGEWEFRGGEWVATYQVCRTDDWDEVRAEVSRQLQAFENIMGRLPTHIDSHQHVHGRQPVAQIVFEHATRLKLPLRHFTPGVTYCGDFFGQTEKTAPFPQGVSVEALVRIIEKLPDGVTELGCHPGFGAGVASVYRHERDLEIATLCDPAVRAVLERDGVQIRSFAGMRIDRP